MSKEEAIKQLKGMVVGAEWLSEYMVEALDMAIKALEQEPSGDLISRQAVIDACEQSINILEAVDRIMDLPSVKQEPPTGHWIADVDKWGDVVTTVNGYKCSECGEFNADNDNYCPNCGAKMVKPDEGYANDWIGYSR